MAQRKAADQLKADVEGFKVRHVGVAYLPSVSAFH